MKNAFELGWKHIKLYFMMGLPFEETADIQGICDLSHYLASTYAKGKRGINVSVTTFIPKPHTPFQRHPQLTLNGTRDRLDYLKQHMTHPKVSLKWQDPRMSLVEGVFSRGDRRLSTLLTAAFENGCRLDGWNDYFDFEKWRAAFDQTGIDPDFYTSRPRTQTEPLPWDHIDTGISPQFLERNGKTPQPAPPPRTAGTMTVPAAGSVISKMSGRFSIKRQTLPLFQPRADRPYDLPDHLFARYRVRFSKLDEARFSDTWNWLPLSSGP